jgi:hypothetical protein
MTLSKDKNAALFLSQVIQWQVDQQRADGETNRDANSNLNHLGSDIHRNARRSGKILNSRLARLRRRNPVSASDTGKEASPDGQYR